MEDEIETECRKLLLVFNIRCHQPRLACCFPFILNLLLLMIFNTATNPTNQKKKMLS